MEIRSEENWVMRKFAEVETREERGKCFSSQLFMRPAAFMSWKLSNLFVYD